MEIYVEQIRDYSEKLKKALNKLLNQLNEAAIPLTEVGTRATIESPVNKLFVARLKDKKIVGMLTLTVVRVLFAKKGLLEDLVVDKEYRGKGIGTKLISSAISQARKEGVAHLDFTSNPKRVEANRLYTHLGFKKRDTNVYRIEL